MERYVWIAPSAAGEYCPLEVMYKPCDVSREDFWRRILSCQQIEWEDVKGSVYVALTDSEAMHYGEMNYKASKLLRRINDVLSAQAEGYYGIVVVAKRHYDEDGRSFIGWLEEEDVMRLKSGHIF